MEWTNGQMDNGHSGLSGRSGQVDDNEQHGHRSLCPLLSICFKI